LAFEGCHDAITPVTHILSENVKARYVKFQPIAFCGEDEVEAIPAPVLRVELYGKGVEQPLGMETGGVGDSQLSSR
jgi:hypothetical protein